MAVDGAVDLARALRGTAFNWVILGDFNVDLLEEPMTGVAANGLLWPWDTVFEHEEVLPGTKTSGRRIDYAVGNGVLVPSAVQQRWWHSDHALVSYRWTWSCLRGTRALRGGRFGRSRSRRTSGVMLGRLLPLRLLCRRAGWTRRGRFFRTWRRACWPILAPRGCLARLLGDRRPCSMLAARRQMDVSRFWWFSLTGFGAGCSNWRRQPRDQRLRDRIARQAGELTARAPWLRELPYFEAEDWCEWMREHIDQEEETQRAAAISAWRQRLDKDPKELATWIRRRDQLGAELARPVPGEAGVAKAAIHPVRVVREAEATWMARWGKPFGTGQVEALLTQLPQLPQHWERNCWFVALIVGWMAGLDIESWRGPSPRPARRFHAPSCFSC